jgi:hypothetical protein
MLDNERSSGLIKGVSLGAVRPGGNVVKKLTLLGMGAGGERIIDISVQSRPLTAVAIIPPDESNIENATADVTETLRTLVVPVAAPITVAYDVSYRNMPNKLLGIADLRAYETNDSDCWEAVVLARFEFLGPRSLKMENVTLIRQVTFIVVFLLVSNVDGRINLWLQDNDECKIADSSLTSQTSDVIADGKYGSLINEFFVHESASQYTCKVTNFPTFAGSSCTQTRNVT